MANLIKKVSLKTVVGNIKGMLIKGEIPDGMAVMRVIGVARNYKEDESDYGPYVAFIGSFKAINLLSGEEFCSGKMFLPDVAGDLVLGQLSQDGSNAVEFGFDITIIHDEDAATGYVYGASPLIEPADDDPLERLAASMPALPKPKLKAKNVPIDKKAA